jgi:DNA-binding NtrC family response regulator
MKEEDLWGKEVILFVEDDKEVSDFACTALNDFGYQVYTALHGIDALELIKAKNIKIDLLVTDLVMPDMDGRELSEKIKEKSPDIDVLFVSGYANNHIVHSGGLEKDINFLQKPFSVHSLLQKVREILDKN